MMQVPRGLQGSPAAAASVLGSASRPYPTASHHHSGAPQVFMQGDEGALHEELKRFPLCLCLRRVDSQVLRNARSLSKLPGREAGSFTHPLRYRTGAKPSLVISRSNMEGEKRGGLREAPMASPTAVPTSDPRNLFCSSSPLICPTQRSRPSVVPNPL